MPDTALLTVLTSAGVAGVFCVLFICGLLYPKSVVDDLRAERDALRAQVESERDRADASVAAAQASRDVLSALQVGVTLGHPRHEDARGVSMRETRELREPGPA